MLCLMLRSGLKSTRSWSSSEDGVSLLSSASEKSIQTNTVFIRGDKSAFTSICLSFEKMYRGK